MMDKISVLIPVYQEPLEYVRKSIASIQNQTYKNIEILIGIDDPKNIQIIDYCKKIDTLDGNIRVFVNDDNLGLSDNLNNLIQHATGSYIARMDADDIALNTRLEKQLFFIKNNNLDFISGSYLSIDENGKKLNSVMKMDLMDKEVRKIEKYGNILTHPLWLVKKDILKSLTYRNAEPVEDYDLIARALLLSDVKFGYMGEPLLEYRIRKNSASHKSPQRIVLMSSEVGRCIIRKKEPNVKLLKSISCVSDDANVFRVRIIQFFMLLRYKLIRVWVERKIKRKILFR